MGNNLSSNKINILKAPDNKKALSFDSGNDSREYQAFLADSYGHARAPETIAKLEYGRFRNVYLYITMACQLNCKHCYLGDRLQHKVHMPTEKVKHTLEVWRKMGGSKLNLIGGEPTLHPDFIEITRFAKEIGYEKVILNTNGLRKAREVLMKMDPEDISYVQVSLDGGLEMTHDQIRGHGNIKITWKTIEEITARGFDTRVICTVNKVNIDDCLDLLDKTEKVGASLLKFHVFSTIGNGGENAQWVIKPREWMAFCEKLKTLSANRKMQVWYQPTYASKDNITDFAKQGYRGCLGKTMDRISIFPDGKAYVCSFLFDTEMNMFYMDNGHIKLNPKQNECDLFTSTLSRSSCNSCSSAAICVGGCPAEKLIEGEAACSSEEKVIPICRLWKSDCV